MNITLYSLHKRINSTKRPSGEGLTMTVVLKDATSAMNPSFKIAMDDSIMQFNYLQAWGKYYWINDIVSIHNGLWLLECSLDCLATYKENIQESNCYVAYSSDSYNLYIPDSRMVLRNQRTVNYTTAAVNILDYDGVFCFSSIGNETNSNGFCNFYVMSRSAVAQIASKLLEDKGFLVQAKEWFSSALETIVGCHWLPVTLPTSGTTVKLGDMNTGVSAGTYASNTVETVFSVSPTWAGNYTDGAPYKSMSLFLPYIGVVELSPSDFWRENIQVQCVIDVHTGDICYMVGTGTTQHTIATFNGNCACTIPVSTYKTDLGSKVSALTSGLSTAASAAGGITSALMRGDVAGAITAVAGGVGAGAQNTFDTLSAMFKKTPSMVGGFGGAAGVRLGNNAVLVEMQNLTSETVTAKQNVLGLPNFRTMSLLNLSGYVQTVGASVRTVGNTRIDQAINSALDGGIYIE